MHKKFPDLPPIWALGFAVLAILLGRLLPIVSFDVPRWLAFLPIILGFALIIGSAMLFLKQKTPIEPHNKPKSLIVAGPYRFSRNPIYLGMLLGLLGIALYAGALLSLIVIAGFVPVINRRFIAWEEAMLRETFGAEAEEFLASNNRWIAGVF